MSAPGEIDGITDAELCYLLRELDSVTDTEVPLELSYLLQEFERALTEPAIVSPIDNTEVRTVPE